MSHYRRWFVDGGTYFFTIVTQDRRPILTTDHGREFLRNAIKKVQQSFPYELIATCLLPEHWHLVMQLPRYDSNYSIRIKRIKTEFTRQWMAAGHNEVEVSKARSNKGERGIWQPRFWEHTVHDEADLERCCDYIHWNPVKHGLVERARDWPWSSFHRFVTEGQYEIDWGGTDPEVQEKTLRLGRIMPVK